LGYVVVDELKANKHLDKRLRKYIKSVYALDRLGMKTQTLDIKVKTHLIKAFCRPVLLYGIEAVYINKGYMTKLKKHEGLLVKRALGLSKRSRHTKVLMAVGLEPTEQTVERRKGPAQLSIHSRPY
jgi:hypothetical protein